MHRERVRLGGTTTNGLRERADRARRAQAAPARPLVPEDTVRARNRAAVTRPVAAREPTTAHLRRAAHRERQALAPVTVLAVPLRVTELRRDRPDETMVERTALDARARVALGAPCARSTPRSPRVNEPVSTHVIEVGEVSRARVR